MVTGVELPQVDLAKMEACMAEEQRALLKLALHGDTKKPKNRRHPDETAAAKLLYYFSQEMIFASEVQESIMDGAREIAAYVVNETILRQDGQPVTVSPLMYFHGVGYKKKGPKNKKGERISLATAFNDPYVAGHSRGRPLMSRDEAQFALTRKWLDNDTKDVENREKWPDKRERKDWPKTVEAVERALIKYVKERHGITDPERCRNYVHASFEHIAWHDDATKGFIYPPEWER